MVSALEARAYFLFGGKKKVAKEKATPGSEPRVAGSPALLGGLGGSLNSPPLGGSDNASRRLPSPLRCSVPLKGPEATGLKQLSVAFHPRSGLRLPEKAHISPFPDALPPMEDAEQRPASTLGSPSLW